MMYEFPQVGFVEAFKLFWTNYVNFKGRSRRSEYWWVMLWHAIISLSITFISFIFVFIPVIGPFIAIILWLLIGLYSLATFIPNLALLVRRFHDRNMTMFLPIFSFVLSIIYNIVYFIGMWQSGALMSTDNFDETSPMLTDASSGWLIVAGILIIVMLVVQVIIFIFTLLDSKVEANKYGPSPKYMEQPVQANNQDAQPMMSHNVPPEGNMPTQDDIPTQGDTTAQSSATTQEDALSQSTTSNQAEQPTQGSTSAQDDTGLTDLDDLETQERKPQDDPYKY
ncbi:MAG: DUF805 domain-containing protein [Staphylococcus rostri]|uniref:DUF805 domain-containing protein n=1 Tax=Staphylococcus rostri TaxID=522262 RepID=UPI0026E02D25|nr:DUF805 domain-containing protein [Staphylococcus rostri]MDO5375420.1 DUF805 domain-containing protein [Staphylococcus rostri]